jgi:hypothetical protein
VAHAGQAQVNDTLLCEPGQEIARTTLQRVRCFEGLAELVGDDCSRGALAFLQKHAEEPQSVGYGF